MNTQYAVKTIKGTAKETKQYPVKLYLCRVCRPYVEEAHLSADHSNHDNAPVCDNCGTQRQRPEKEQSFFFHLPTRDELNLFASLQHDTAHLVACAC